MITTSNLYYAFNDGSIALSDVNLDLPDSSRTLLIGANGAGKSTLLRVLAGKTLAKAGTVFIDGKDPFREGLSGTTYLGTEWASNTTVRRDLPVALLIASVGGDAYPERRDELVDILDIDIRWRMHAVSDGERRRVQLCMGLLRPWTTLLLDEVTVDLDVLVRSRLLDFLKKETESRSCQIVYATHIFDGLMGWSTHVAHLHLGTVLEHGDTETVLKQFQSSTGSSQHIGTPLMEMALSWLTKDVQVRGVRKEKVKWEDVAEDIKNSLGQDQDHFNQYFKLTRGRS